MEKDCGELENPRSLETKKQHVFLNSFPPDLNYRNPAAPLNVINAPGWRGIDYDRFNFHRGNRLFLEMVRPEKFWAFMQTPGWIQFSLYVVALVAITKSTGLYLLQILDANGRTWLDVGLRPIERATYRLITIFRELQPDLQGRL